MKPTTGHRILVIETLQSIMADWFEHAVEIGAAPLTIEAMRLEYRQLEKRKQALLSPVPKRPSKPRKPKTVAPTVAEHAATGEPIARYEVNTDNLNRRGRYNRNGGT
jgi:hypothetical protein